LPGDKIINPIYLRVKTENPYEEGRPSPYEIRKMRKVFKDGVFCAKYYEPLPTNIDEYLNGEELARKKQQNTPK